MNYFRQLDEKTYLEHRYWMKRAIALAASPPPPLTPPPDGGDVPVGVVVVCRGELIAQSANCKEREQDPTAHAEIIALRSAAKVLNTWHLNDCHLYVTLEPCPMCAGAIIQARIGLLIYGVDDPKTGAIRTVTNLPDSACSNHKLAVISGIMEYTCREQLQTWFSQRRSNSLLHD